MFSTVASWLFEQKVDACSACWVRMYHVLATLKWASFVFCQSCSRSNLELGTWKLKVTTLPAQFGNLGALPTYTACIS